MVPTDSTTYLVGNVAFWGDEMIYVVNQHLFKVDINHPESPQDMGFDINNNRPCHQVDSLVFVDVKGGSATVVNLANGKVSKFSGFYLPANPRFLKTPFGLFIFSQGSGTAQLLKYDAWKNEMTLVYEGDKFQNVMLENGIYTLRTSDAVIAEGKDGYFTDTVGVNNRYYSIANLDSVGIYYDGINRKVFKMNYATGDTARLPIPDNSFFTYPLVKKQGNKVFIYNFIHDEISGLITTDGTVNNTRRQHDVPVHQLTEKGDTLIEVLSQRINYYVKGHVVKTIDMHRPNGVFHGVLGNVKVFYNNRYYYAYRQDTGAAYPISRVKGKTYRTTINALGHKAILMGLVGDILIHYTQTGKTRLLPGFNRRLIDGSLESVFITKNDVYYTTDLDDGDDARRKVYVADLDKKKSTRLIPPADEWLGIQVYVAGASKNDLVSSTHSRIFYRVPGSDRLNILTPDDGWNVPFWYVDERDHKTYYGQSRAVYETDGSPAGTKPLITSTWGMGTILAMGDSVLVASQGIGLIEKDGDLTKLFDGVGFSGGKYYSSNWHKAVFEAKGNDKYRLGVTNGNRDSSFLIPFYDQFMWISDFDEKYAIQGRLIIPTTSYDYSRNITSLNVRTNQAHFIMKNFTFNRILGKDKNHLYFAGLDSLGTSGIWKSDGTKEGTHYLIGSKEGVEVPWSNGLRRFGGGDSRRFSGAFYKGKLFFPAEKEGYGIELWQSDGTKEGTKMVEDYLKGPNGIRPYSLQVYEDKLLFVGESFEHGVGFYSYDGITVGKHSSANMNHELTVYPNPANSIVHVQSTFQVAKVQVFDQQGKLVLEERNLNGKQVSIGVGELISGIYVLKTQGPLGVYSSKLLIDRN